MTENREYLTRLLGEIRERLHDLEQQRVRMVTAPVTAIDTIGNTFTVSMPVQEDGTSLSIAGIAAPATFMPAIGDTISLQVVGAVPQYQPGTIAPDVVTDREIAPGVTNKVFRQATSPTAVDIGDVWVNTADGNKEYIWGPIGVITRQNLALNPSFEYDAVGTVTAITGWTNYTLGTPGSATVSVTNAGTGIAIGTKAGKVVAASLPATNNTAVGFQQSYLATPGDVWNIQAVMTLAVTDTNKKLEMLVEWTDGSFAVLGSSTVVGSGTSTSQQSLVYNGTALPASTAFVRLTLRRRANGTGSALVNADLIVDAVCVERNRSAQSPTGYFDGDNPNTTDSKWDTPGTKPNSTSTYWQPSTAGTNQWYPVLWRSAAVQPGSLVASNVVASGTVTAPLLEAVLILGSTIIAGDPAGDHTTMQADGLHIFQDITGEGMLEVGRIGTSANDFFSVTNSTGQVVASIDDAGGITGSSVVTDSLSVAGDDYQATINGVSSGVVARFSDFTPNITPIITEYGVAETAGALDKTRAYLIVWQCVWTSAVAMDECYFRIRYNLGTDGDTTTQPASPTITSTQFQIFYQTVPVGNRFLSVTESSVFIPSATTRYRFLLTAVKGVGTGPVSIISLDAQHLVQITVVDLGPSGAVAGGFNNGGGTLSGGSAGTPTPSTPQQYDTGYLSSSAHYTYRATGGGVLRTDTTDVVQGLDPSGFNGDGQGQWRFTIPNITGTVNRVDFQVYVNHTYFNSGGSGLFNISTQTGVYNPTQIMGSDDVVAGYPNPGTKTITFPSSWYTNFKSKTAITVTAGPSLSSNELYYVRYSGTSAKLRIWYTQ